MLVIIINSIRFEIEMEMKMETKKMLVNIWMIHADMLAIGCHICHYNCESKFLFSNIGEKKTKLQIRIYLFSTIISDYDDDGWTDRQTDCRTETIISTVTARKVMLWRSSLSNHLQDVRVMHVSYGGMDRYLDFLPKAAYN